MAAGGEDDDLNCASHVGQGFHCHSRLAPKSRLMQQRGGVSSPVQIIPGRFFFFFFDFTGILCVYRQ